MQTKLTLRMEDTLIQEAKILAASRGKSVSQMFGEFVRTLDTLPPAPQHPPLTASLLGALKGHDLSEEDYRKHLREKHA